MPPPTRRSDSLKNPWTALLAVLACVPFFGACAVVYVYSVNIPVPDEWVVSEILDHPFELHELMKTYHDHCLLVPRLLNLALGALHCGDVRAMMALGLALLVFRSVCMFALSKKTTSASFPRNLYLLLIANILTFTPSQHESLLTGLWLCYFVGLTAVTFGVLVCYLELSHVYRFVLCASACTISTFTFGNGPLTWIVLFPVLFYADSWKEFLRKKRSMLVWILLTIACISVLAHYLEREGGAPQFAVIIERPLEAPYFLDCFLGRTLAFGSPGLTNRTSEYLGAIMLAAYAAALVYVFGWGDAVLRRRCVGWFSIGAMSLLSALMVTVGRLGYGSGASLIPRYISTSIGFPVSIVYLTWIVLSDETTHRRIASASAVLRWRNAVSAALLVLASVSALWGIKSLPALRLDRLRGKAAVRFINIAVSERLLAGVARDSDYVKLRATRLNQLHLLSPPLAESNDINPYTVASAGGRFESLLPLRQNQFIARGWATLPESAEPAHAVIFTYASAGRDIIFHLAPVGLSDAPPLGPGKQEEAFSEKLDVTHLPSDAGPIKAWAYDARSGIAHPLEGLFSLPPASAP